MQRVAYIVPSLAPLGPVIVVRNLVERMVAHGHDCVVFYFDEREKGMTLHVRRDVSRSGRGRTSAASTGCTRIASDRWCMGRG